MAVFFPTHSSTTISSNPETVLRAAKRIKHLATLDPPTVKDFLHQIRRFGATANQHTTLGVTETLADRGVDSSNNDVLMDYLQGMPIMSPAAKGAGTLMALNNHAPLFPVHLVEKDFRYILQAAKKLGVIMSTAATVHEIYQEAITQGYGSNNITNIASLFN